MESNPRWRACRQPGELLARRSERPTLYQIPLPGANQNQNCSRVFIEFGNFWCVSRLDTRITSIHVPSGAPLLLEWLLAEWTKKPGKESGAPGFRPGRDIASSDGAHSTFGLRRPCTVQLMQLHRVAKLARPGTLFQKKSSSETRNALLRKRSRGCCSSSP